jgi:ABC-type oligopeptide transport system ATPase subunit
VRYLSDHIGVIYLGKLVEVGPAGEVYLRPATGGESYRISMNIV